MKNKSLLAVLLSRGAVLLTPVGMGACVIGCAGGPPQQELTLRSGAQHQTFSQQFANAYLSRDGDGDVDVVLLDRAAQQRLDGIHGSAPTQQVMHLRVLWNPKRDQKADHSSASNATVHWYVMGNTPGAEGDVLEYAGTAFVAMDDSTPAELTIRNGIVRPVACRGGLCDPVGPSVISGTIFARPDRQRVRQVLTGIRIAVAAANELPNRVTSAARPESPSSLAR